MTYEEIIKELELQEISVEDFAYGDIKNPIVNIGPWKEVEQVGGEGQGDTWYSVHYFEDHKLYIQTNGRYSSYDGVTFYGGYALCTEEVFPVEVKVIQYHTKPAA